MSRWKKFPGEGCLVLSLDEGEKLPGALLDACREAEITAAAVVSAVGRISGLSLGFFRSRGDYAETRFDETLEIVTISGLVSRNPDGEYHAHLHISVADGEKKVRGGHLIGGRVETTCEVVLLAMKGAPERFEDEKTGLRLLKP